MSVSRDGSSQQIRQADGISCDVLEPLDEDNTLGIAENVEPGETTIVKENPRGKFWVLRDRRADPDDHVFISCDGGDGSVHMHPEFAPIETCITKRQYDMATSELAGIAFPSLRMLFDDSGLVIFETDEAAVACAPTTWEWDKPITCTSPRAGQ